VGEVEKLLLFINKDKPPSIDNLDGKLLRIVADCIATPISIQRLKECMCPQEWKEAKVIPLPKNSKALFAGSNTRPISLLHVLSKLIERIVFDQIQCYF
jgi:hypothetical protein